MVGYRAHTRSGLRREGRAGVTKCAAYATPPRHSGDNRNPELQGNEGLDPGLRRGDEVCGLRHTTPSFR